MPEEIKLKISRIPSWVTDSRYQTQFERDFLLAVHQKDLYKFQVRVQYANVDINKYIIAINACVEIFCRSPGYEDFIEVLLAADFNPNSIIIHPGITAIHLACINANSSALCVLLMSKRTNVNMVSGHGKTALHYLAERILETAEDEEAVRQCVGILLKHPEIYVSKSSITDWTLCGNALHLAARCDNHVVVKALLDDGRMDVNAEDAYGWTALHYAARLCKSNADGKNFTKNCFLLLLKDPKIQVNKQTNHLTFEVTPLHLAAAVGNYVAIEALIKDPRMIVGALDTRERNALHYAAEQSAPRSELVKRNRFAIAALVKFADIDFNCPDFYEWIAIHLAVSKGNFAYVIVMLQEDGGVELCSADVKKKLFSGKTALALMDENDCHSRIRRSVSILMNHPDIDVNQPSYMGLTENITPIILAAKAGNYIALEQLIKNKRTDLNVVDPDRKTVLHYAAENYVSDRAQRCITLLLEGPGKERVKLEMATRYKHDINARDTIGDTALYIAAKRKIQPSVLTLLRNGASIAERGQDGSSVPYISPNTFECFLNECIETNGKSPEDENFHVTFSYKFLTRNCEEAGDYYPESDPLYHMSLCRKTRYLLKHPVISSFLHLKWQRVSTYFYANVLYHLFFVLLLNMFILRKVGHETKENEQPILNTTNNTDINGSLTNDTDAKGYSMLSRMPPNIEDGFVYVLWTLLRFLLVGLLLKELFQFIISPFKYLLNVDNYIELLVIIGSILNMYGYLWIGSEVEPHISAITILLSWIKIVLLTGRFSKLSCQLEMLKKVSWTFIKFLAWYSILLIAFSLCFYILFYDRHATNNDKSEESFNFSNIGKSLLKTTVMMSGEFEASSLDFSLAPMTSHVLFVVFVFFIAIVMLNLLNGLAVSDTQCIRQQAEVLSLISRVHLIYYIESMFLGDPLTSCWMSKNLFGYLRSRSGLLKRIHRSILLFPHVVLQNKVWVLPNRGNRVVYTEPLNMAHENVQVSYKFERSWFKDLKLDPDIIRLAMDKITTKDHNEKDVLKETQNKIDTAMKKIDGCVKTLTKKKQNEIDKVLENILAKNMEILENKIDKSMSSLDLRIEKRLQDIEKSEQENKVLLRRILTFLEQKNIT